MRESWFDSETFAISETRSGAQTLYVLPAAGRCFDGERRDARVPGLEHARPFNNLFGLSYNWLNS
jgi:hypothetical protein